MNPYEEYEARRSRWQTERQRAERLFIRIGNWRLTLGVTGAVLAYLVFSPHLIPLWLLALPVLAFIALAAWHSRVMRRRTLADRALRFYHRGLARLNDQWAGTGNTGNHFQDPSHIYSSDLDLFGKGSLFELISNTRTAAGESTLAQWLLAPAPRKQVIRRQAAVEELRSRLDLREDLALLGGDVQADVHVDALQRWGTAPPIVFPAILRLLAALLGCIGVILLFGFFAQQIPFWALAASLGINIALSYALRLRVNQVLEMSGAPGHGLDVLSLVLARLERESFRSPLLQEIHQRLTVEDQPASARVAQLRRWMDWLDSSDHPLVKAIRPSVLWREQIAMGVEAWRRHSGQHISEWLSAVAELEALSSFATLAFERTHWSFPVLAEDDKPPHFEARALQHPLLPAARSIANNVAFTDELKLLIVSGSNMSGKSTLLRAVGLNCVLAWAGAPVAAEELRLSSLQTAASIRITDSLLDNRSRFFAEIMRLRQIVDFTGESRPVLFLLDEVLSGTNSHDRLIGAAAIIHKLVGSGAIGLVTTHDLALARIQEDLGSSARNVHFDDRIVNGQIEFDYRLKPGVITRSNALELMRAVGLEV